MKNREEIEALEATHAQAPHERLLQKALAEEVTARVHSAEELNKAIQASEILFGRGTEESLRQLDEATLLSVFEGVPRFEIARDALASGIAIVELLAEHSQVFSSKGEARKMLQANGVALNKSKISGDRVVQTDDLLNDRLLLVQKGKKNYFLLIAV